MRALTTLTLVAGLASTVFAPLAVRPRRRARVAQAYLVLLAGLVVITVPLHWWGLDHPWRVARRATATHRSREPAGRARRRRRPQQAVRAAHRWPTR